MSEALNTILPGDRVGPYRIVRGFEGRGGMGRIFEVEVRKKHQQPHLPNRLALKVAKEAYEGALKAEANYLRRFDHDNVVRVLPIAGYHKRVYAARAHFRFGWGWYYTMELLKGGSLDRRLTRPTTVTDWLNLSTGESRRLGVLQTVGIGRQLADALDHIHRRHVVNLDVKPANVLFRRRRLSFLRSSVPQAVLCDFGISRDVRYPRAGLLGVATPEYVSPEQASEAGQSHQHVDSRSDIFSLGVLLYEALTGTLPFENPGLVLHPSYMPPAPTELRSRIPDRLSQIIMRALEKNPNRRFRTAREMHDALSGVRTPLDWGAAARRTVAGATLAACFLGGRWGVVQWVGTAEETPTPSPTAPSAVESATDTPTPEPATPTPTAPEATTPLKPTSTLRPTLTPTNTPKPPTVTPTPVPDATPSIVPDAASDATPEGG